MADISILDPSVAPAPKAYTIHGAQEIILKGVTATFDGSGAAGFFVPAVQVVDPSGFVVGTYIADSTLAAGASATISWFPGLGSAASSGASIETTNTGGTVTVNPTTELLLGTGLSLTQPVVGIAEVTATSGLLGSPLNPGMIASEKGWAEFDNAGDVLPKGAAAKTFECWGHLNGDPGLADLYFYEHGPHSVANDSFAFEHNGNVAFAPNLGFANGSAVFPFTNFFEWNDSVWHHFVLTYDGATTVQLYLDGVAASPLTVPVQNVGASKKLTIGNFAGHTLGTAFVDELAIYSGQLSAARVLAHFNARVDGTYSTQVLADSPIVYYRFADAGPGLVMADSSGHGHTGTYSGLFTPNSAANNFVYGVTFGAVA